MRAMRRVALLALICVFCQSTGAGWAQTYPAKVVRLIQPGSAGSGADILARLVAGGLVQVFGQQVIVDNRPGAAANIGAEIAAKAPPDGYTLLLVNIAHAANVSLYKKLPYDLIRDFSAVTQIAGSPHVVVVHPSLPVKSIKELVELAKAKPGAINYASVGVGTSTFWRQSCSSTGRCEHGERVVQRRRAGGDLGRCRRNLGLFLPSGSGVTPHPAGQAAHAGSDNRQTRAFDARASTLAESGYPGYAFNNWYGLVVPAKTPKRRSQRSARGDNGPEQTGCDQAFERTGYVIVGDQPDEFAAYIGLEVEKLGKLIKALHLTTEAPR